MSITTLKEVDKTASVLANVKTKEIKAQCFTTLPGPLSCEAAKSGWELRPCGIQTGNTRVLSMNGGHYPQWAQPVLPCQEQLQGPVLSLSESEVAQSCPTLCDSTDCSLPGFSVHGIFQARILEWAAISFSRGSSRPRDQTQVSRTVGRHFTVWTTREAPCL